MAQTVIQIKRSLGNAAPGQLRPGEFAYSSAETGQTGTTAGVLYIGGPSADGHGFATTNYVIGGTKYTSLLDVEKGGKLTNGKAIVTDKDGGIDTIHGVKEESGQTKLVIGLADTPNQQVVIHDPYVKGKNGQMIKLDQFIDEFVKDGVITLTAGDGIANITNQNGTYNIALKPTGAVAGKYGSETKVPSFTINQYGQITEISEKTISTKMNVENGTGDNAGTVDLINGKMVFGDGIKLDTHEAGTIKAEVDETVVRTTGAQSIAGVKTMSDMPVVTADQSDVKTGNANEVAKLGTIKAQTVYTDSSENGTTVALGGIPKGTKYTDTDVTKILHELLHPYVAPTGVSLTLNENGGVFEKGVTKHITSGTVRWTNGSTRVEKAEILVGGNAKGTQTVAGVKNNQAVTLTAPMDVKDNTTFTARVTEDSKKQAITGGNVGFTFVYPFYHGVLEASVSVTEDVIKGLQKDVSVKGTKSYTYDTGKIEKQVVIAYPASYGDLKSILDPNKFENIDKFKGAKSTVTITGLDNTPQQYIVYAPKTNVENMKFTFSF